MPVTRFRFDKIYTPLHVVHDGVLVVDGGRVVGVSEGGGFDVDYRGFVAAPGMVDTHTHGCMGIEVTLIRDVKELASLAKCYAAHGVTSFLPTTVSALHEDLVRVSRVVRDYIRLGVKGGARVLGLNLEGPYINPKRKGAQNPQAIRPPSIEEFSKYIEESGGGVRIITVAPEIPGGLEFIEYAASRGVIVSIGHTDADYSTVMRAIAHGASRATHLFSAMPGIHHRELGAVSALLDSEDVYLELITDLVHVKPEVILFVLKYAGIHRVVSVTDSMSAAGLGEGEYTLGGLRVIVKGGRAVLADQPDTLAGSVATMDVELRNLVNIGLSLNDALRLTSMNPALSINEPRLGCLKPGCAADFIVLDGKLNVTATYVEGELVYKAG